MKRKGKSLIFAIALAVILACGCCFTACGETEPAEHTHTLQKVDAVAPTCTAEGNIEYRKCSGCGKFFSDAAGSKEITDKASVVLAKKSHSYVEKTDDKQHWRSCDVCGEAAGAKEDHTYAVSVTGLAATYDVGASLPAGVTAALSCADCAWTKEIGVTAAMVTGFDTSSAGAKKLTVTVYAVAGDESTKVQKIVDYTVERVVISTLVTFDGLTYDGESTAELEEGAKLDMAKNIGRYPRG